MKRTRYLVRWFSGSLVQWFDGSVIRWVDNGWLVSRFGSLMDHWFGGSMVRRFCGLMDRWFDGSLVRWISGSMDLWFDGSLVRWSLLDVQNIRWFVFCSRTKMAFAFQLFHVSLFLVFLSIHSPVVNPSNIPKTWLDFVQSCIASFKSSGAKHCFSNVFYPSGGDHAGGPEAYRIPPVILWNPLIQTECDLACP